MSVPAAEFWFSTVIRRNRKSFLLANLLLIGIIFAVMSALLFFTATPRAASAIMILFYIPFVIVQYFLTAQRLRDLNISGWFALFWLIIPLAPNNIQSFLALSFLLLLCFIPGTNGDNRYGIDPIS